MTYEEIQQLFHRLWTRAVGTEGYVKADWKRLGAAIEEKYRSTMEPERHNVHEEGFDEHRVCPDPACCECECRTCKRTWFSAGRPSPKDCPRHGSSPSSPSAKT